MARLARRHLLGSSVTAVAALVLGGCTRLTDQDRAFIADTTGELLDIPGVASGEVTVRRDWASTPQVSVRAVGADGRTRPEVERTALAVHDLAVERDLPSGLAGAALTVRLMQTVGVATVELGLARASAAEAIGRWRAALSEIDNGASSVVAGEMITSTLTRVDDAVIADVPDGASGGVVRRVPAGGDGPELSVHLRRGESVPQLPVTEVASALLTPSVARVELRMSEGDPQWQVHGSSEDVADAAFADGLTVALRALVGSTVIQQVQVRRPWWVDLTVSDTVTVTRWTGTDRAETEPIVTAVLARVRR